MHADLRERARAFADSYCLHVAYEDRVPAGCCQDCIATLLSEVRAETEARAVEAAAQVADDEADSLMTSARHIEADPCWIKQQLCAEQAATGIARRIRALAPADYVAMRRETLAATLDIVDAAISESGNLSDGLDPDEADAVREIRTALSRAGKGE